MHKEFADWYRQASVAPTSELLASRWSGVEKLSKGLTKTHLVDLLLLFSRDPGEAFVAPDYLDGAFRESDGTFPTKGNVHELRVLAGAVLRAVIDKGGPASTAAAYGIVCGSFGVAADSVPSTEHVERAKAFLAEKAGSVREVRQVPAQAGNSITKELLEAELAAGFFALPGNLRDPLIATLLKIVEASRLASDLAVNSLTKLVNVQREELDLLWWLQNSYSSELNRPLGEMSLAERCLVVSFDLARITKFVPGSSAVLGLIIASVSHDGGQEQLSLKEAVIALPRTWRESQSSTFKGGQESAICPVRTAIFTSLETDGDDDWIPVFSKRSRVDAKTKRLASVIAYEAYLENMFVRALGELK